MSRFIEGLQHLANSRNVRLTLAGGAALGTTAFALPDCNPSPQDQKPPVTTEGQMPSQDLQLIETFKALPQDEQRTQMKSLTQKVEDLGKKYFFYSGNPNERTNTYNELVEASTQKALLLQTHPDTFNRTTRFSVTPSKRTIAVNSEVYELDKPSDFIFASALIDPNPRYPISYVRTSANDINNLHKKVSFEIAGPPLLGDFQSLARLSQVLQIFENNGKPIPQKVRYPVIPFYSRDRLLTADQQLRGLDKDAYYVISGVLADFYLKSDKGPFAQYKEWVGEEFNNSSNAPMRRPDLAAANGVYLPRTDEVDFITTFREYFTDGVSLRKRIYYTYARGYTTENRILSTKHEALRSWFGAEIQVNGVIKDQEEYSVGEAIWIDDYVARQYYELGGIFLRPEPTLHTDQRMKVLTQGAEVRIMDGPVTLVDDSKEEAMNMWKVEVGDFIFNNRSFMPWGDGWEGWVSDEWFSKKPVER